MRAQLRIAYTDGSVDWVLTDEKWKADLSPTLRAEIYDGETFDARKVQPNWDTATFVDARWKNVELIQPKNKRQSCGNTFPRYAPNKSWPQKK